MNYRIVSWVLRDEPPLFRIGQFICHPGSNKGSAAVFDFVKLSVVGTTGAAKTWENVTEEEAKLLTEQWDAAHRP